MAQNKICRLPLSRLVEHEANPNRMNKSTFEKLVRNIDRTGNYEPIVVRKHPSRAGDYQVINGHHRRKALMELDRTHADCVVWDVDDDETMVLLATLNRLGGQDDLQKKRELIEQLAKKYSSDDLAKITNETQASIQTLKDLRESCIEAKPAKPEMLVPEVFYLREEQQEAVRDSIAKACPEAGTKAQKRAAALVKICRAYEEAGEQNG
ncbi:plasmid partitioning protein RepB [Anaerohalosphaera lusitana]|uniref:Plasmid partitioning protein RepB n=1 Tax=Anaerohalosphaera lusitana TaxID=1936003 RepID=A0A1U9NGU9_9BACT|nr:ParB N-terminal domain-containing protein [Anaerohalosphaera lusitana]AQT66964.1 plasmid partitioning protein RepB [Anaerohalosphaera lusitana]